MITNSTAVQTREGQSVLAFVRYASTGAVAGPALFAIAWLALGCLQPTVRTQYGLIGGLSGAVTNPISALGVGPHAELFNCAFVLCGLLTLVGVFAAFATMEIKRPTTRCKWCAALFALSPIGLALAGVFTLADSLAMHNVAALLLFVVPLLAFPVSARYFRRIAQWRRYGTFLLSAGPITFVLLVLFISTFHLSAIVAGTGAAGLTERLLLTEIHVWYVALGWHAFRL